MLRKRELPRKLAPQGRQLTRLGLPRHLLLHRKASPKLWGAPVSLVWCNIYKDGHEQQGCGACKWTALDPHPSADLSKSPELVATTCMQFEAMVVLNCLSPDVPGLRAGEKVGAAARLTRAAKAALAKLLGPT